jgi:hypothetical protein
LEEAPLSTPRVCRRLLNDLRWHVAEPRNELWIVSKGLQLMGVACAGRRRKAKVPRRTLLLDA